MDVAFVTRFNDSRNEGGGNYSKLICDGLKMNKDINLHILTQDDSILKTDSKYGYGFYSFLELKYLLNKKEFKDCDVQHAVTIIESLYVDKKKAVAGVLDIPKNGLGNSFSDKLFDKCVKSACECERIIVINEDIVDRLKKFYGADEDKIEVIYPSIPQNFYPKDIERDDDKFIVGTIARVEPRKRDHLLVQSFLEADMEDAELWIGGKGPELENLKKLANGDERVKFLGFVPDEKVNDFYNTLDLFVFPTAFEGYGMPMVEAMACKKPVITLDDADIPQHIREKTFVCSKEELADVLRNRTYSCDIKRNLDFANDHTIENRAKEVVGVYKSIL